ncbi:MAG: ATP-binding cassette domain-containing protein, partial [Acidobacteriaceae bacterium]
MAETVVNPQTVVSPRMAEFLASGRPMVEFDDVSIGFEGNQVLTGVSFSVAHGETRILLGPAGGGKSVLMKLANGLIEPDSGEVRVFGYPLREMTENEMFEMRAHVGMVFQESALFDSLDVE